MYRVFIILSNSVSSVVKNKWKHRNSYVQVKQQALFTCMVAFCETGKQKARIMDYYDDDSETDRSFFGVYILVDIFSGLVWLI